MRITVDTNQAVRIIGYARVSSREQAENSHALEQQIARLQAAGATEIFVDIESRSNNDRKELNEVLRLIETRQCQEAIFVRVDRMTDSAMLLERAIAICLESEVNIRGLDDCIDFQTVGGRLHARLLVNIARGEVERLAERVKHGWEYLRKRKVAMNPPFGYVKVDNRHELDHIPYLCLLDGQEERTRAQLAREIVDAFFTKRTLRLALRVINERYGIQTFAHNNEVGEPLGGRSAREVFRFSPGGLRTWLTNPVLQGHLCYLRGHDHYKKGRKEIHYNTHPDQRLISDEEAQQIEDILTHNRQVRGYGSTALKYPLSGLVFCGECRSAWYSMKGGRGKNIPGYNYYFQCKNWRLRACSQKAMIRMEVAEAAVIQALTDRAAEITALANQPEPTLESVEVQALRMELAYYQKAPGTRAAAIVSELQHQIESLKLEHQSIDRQQVMNQELLLRCFSDPLFWSTLPDDEKRDIFRALIQRVTVKDGQIVAIDLKV